MEPDSTLDAVTQERDDLADKVAELENDLADVQMELEKAQDDRDGYASVLEEIRELIGRTL